MVRVRDRIGLVRVSTGADVRDGSYRRGAGVRGRCQGGEMSCRSHRVLHEFQHDFAR